MCVCCVSCEGREQQTATWSWHPCPQRSTDDECRRYCSILSICQFLRRTFASNYDLNVRFTDSDEKDLKSRRFKSISSVESPWHAKCLQQICDGRMIWTALAPCTAQFSLAHSCQTCSTFFFFPRTQWTVFFLRLLITQIFSCATLCCEHESIVQYQYRQQVGRVDLFPL